MGIAMATNTIILNHFNTEVLPENTGIRHPRTFEFIDCATEPFKTPRISKIHLNHFPRVAYHRVLNAVRLTSPKVANGKGFLMFRTDGKTFLKRTRQFKTVWLNPKGKHHNREPAVTLHKAMARVEVEQPRTYCSMVRA